MLCIKQATFTNFQDFSAALERAIVKMFASSQIFHSLFTIFYIAVIAILITGH